MRRFDLHVHSRLSPDAKGSIMELAVAAQEAGLHGFAITDHDRVNDAKEIAEASEATGQIIISGCESSSVEGHVLCLGITKAPPKGSGIQQIAKMVAKQGGVCIPAHPLKVLSGIGPTGLAKHWRAGHFVAAEGINGRERRIVQDNTLHLLKQNSIPATGGTDAHWLRDIGTAWTWLDESVESSQQAIEALRQGKCQADGGNIRRRSVWTHGASVPWRKLRARAKGRKHD